MTQETDESRRDADAAAFAVEVVKRAPVFDALLDGPKTAMELEEALSMSRSTIHRATQTFCDQGLLEKTERTFELTGLGEETANQLAAFQSGVRVACRLEPFLNTVPLDEVDVPVEHFEGATVTCPSARQTHFGVKRIIELIEESESLRMFTSIISPVYVDVAHREMLNGTDIEVIFDEELVDIIAEEYHEEAMEAFDSGRFDVLVYDGVPFELFLFDTKLGMAAHDDSGIPRVFVETDDPDAFAWAERLFARYRDLADSASF